MSPNPVSRRQAWPIIAGITWLVMAGAASAQSLAIIGAVVYPGGTDAPIRPATVLIEDGRIAAVGRRVPIPAGYEVIRCEGCAIVAGFWNAHVHFTEPKWDTADKLTAEKLREQLQAMLTRSGFTTVVDTGSLLANTIAIRRRIDSGDVPGPRILTAGVPIYPPDGIPYYVKESLPPELLSQLAPPRNAREAAEAVEEHVREGADIIKLFTGSWVTNQRVLPMPESIAAAAVQAAHRNGRLVFSHSSNLPGTQIAIRSGVDVLAHAPEDTRGIDDALLKRAAGQGMTIIPTLQVFSGSGKIARIRSVVRRFHDLGGRLVFGTDTGFLTDYDIAGELSQLRIAGFSWSDVLQMLTENPARLFQEENSRGRIAAGMNADITVIRGDPAKDPASFAQVEYTIRNGRVVYAAR